MTETAKLLGMKNYSNAKDLECKITPKTKCLEM
jgi:hypothetical protein